MQLHLTFSFFVSLTAILGTVRRSPATGLPEKVGLTPLLCPEEEELIPTGAPALAAGLRGKAGPAGDVASPEEEDMPTSIAAALSAEAVVPTLEPLCC